LYVEAKRLDKLFQLQPDLFGYENRSDDDRQAIAYADQYNPKRGEKIGWAILTNFEHFRLWDTKRNVLVAAVSTYLSEYKSSKILEILYLLSRDQVMLDPALASLSAFRELPEIDEKFLAKLNEWRGSLAGAIWNYKTNRSKLGSTLVEQQVKLREVVQRTLDRLIVIRTAEDRGLLPSGLRLDSMVKNFGGQNSVPLMLLRNIQNNTFAFFDDRYNSKLFGAHLADQMEVHNGPLTLIIEEMCRAGFANMNADILGATYEQYLGQTIEINTEKDSPDLVPNLETRHAQGSYYTPRYIVKYIVDRTLGRYLYGTDNGQPQGKPLGTQGRKRIEDIQSLAVLDPACGSGSFLIYAFDLLLTFYSAEKARIQHELDSRFQAIVATGIPRLAAESASDSEILGLRAEQELSRFAHARIIERHLFGVDLDPQAAEIASMNLLLKALTRDERLPRILGDNIKVGNSLISGVRPQCYLTGYDDQIRQLVEIRQQIHQYTLRASENGEDRDTHEKKIDEFENRFRAVADSLNLVLNEPLRRREESGWFNNPEERRPFNWQVEFPEIFVSSDVSRRGFTTIVGNPPYIRIQELTDKQPGVVEYFNDNYRAATGNYDIYVLFDERGLELLQPYLGARLGYIQPHKFFQAEYGRGIRQVLEEQRSVSAIADFGDFQVFPGGTTYTCLLFLAKDQAEKVSYLDARDGVLDPSGSEPRLAEQVPKELLASTPWPVSLRSSGSPNTERSALKRMESSGITIRSAGHIFVGIQTSADAVFIVESLGNDKGLVRVHSKATNNDHLLESALLRPIISGTDVERYGTPAPANLIIFPYDVDREAQYASLITPEVLEERSPNIWAYLKENKGSLETRERGKMLGDRWYAFGRNQNIGKQHLKKVCVPRLVNRLAASLDNEGTFCLDNVDVGGIVLRENKYTPLLFLAILNSAAANFYLKCRSTTFRGGFVSANRQFLGQIPLPSIEALGPAIVARLKKVEAMAARIIELNRDVPKVLSVFSMHLDATLPVMAGRDLSFNLDYYGIPQYWKNKRLVPPNALQLTEPVAAMKVENEITPAEDGYKPTGRLILSYRSDRGGAWKPLIELEPSSEDLRLFILLAGRRFLAENSRKKVWKLPGKKASERTLEVALASLVLPVWKLPHGSGTAAETTLGRISDIMNSLRESIPGELNPSVLEAERDALDQEIDEIVFDLYGLTADERRLILESTHGAGGL
jgi:type I restriction-modification system DNA methylase subunit